MDFNQSKSKSTINRGVTSIYRRFEFFDSEILADDGEQKIESGNNSAALRNSGRPRQGKDLMNATMMNNDSKEESGSSGLNLFEDFEPVCASAGYGLLCFGGADGKIAVINRDLQIRKFVSHSSRITKIVKTKQMRNFIINIFSLDAVDIDEYGKPKKVKSFKIFPQGSTYIPASALAATDDGSQIAVGCTNGVVKVFDLNLQSKEKNHREREITKENPSPVTGLHYREENQNTLLYVVTTVKIVSFQIRARNPIMVTCVLLCHYLFILCNNDKLFYFCNNNNNNYNKIMKELTLLKKKKKTVHQYDYNDPRGLHAFPGEKKMARSFRRYFIIVTSGVGGMKQGKENRVEVIIYDHPNKYIAFRRLYDDLIDIIHEWGSVFILTKHQLIKLRDKDLQEKLNEFFRSHMYDTAIKLARSEGENEFKIMEYYRDYGDHYYEFCREDKQKLHITQT
ncbi:hypothetical protein RFI_29728 [Reticulomyxa filosa]|uniref:PEP5/VPS11 N-terminal domain-containing protein n=1 Tax=Reticulomyxa filosa TaxID=46433 RepID=X6M0E9_RETFI|nr:hypothetical protein RFI_29728 [Reticulomyxa filosa]|eukprot:ETO07663.1 hypothetical protein RFI_29728 [Reticulomyxa filosa]